MVGMGVGVDNAIQFFDAGHHHLFAEIRAGINHDRGHFAKGINALNQQRGTAAAIFGIVGITRAPIAGYARHTGG